MKRIFWSGRLRFPYGFHTGDGRRLDVADQPLFRAADGRVELAGSSLAGVLRADLRRLLGGRCRRGPRCRCVVCRLFGPEAAERRGTETRLSASRLYVRGGRTEGSPSLRIRDHVGIDRRTRVAADQRKYDVEIVDAGAVFPFELRLDHARREEIAALECVLRRLAGGWLFLGGKTASGLGRAEVVALKRHELDLSDPPELVRHLLDEAPGEPSTDLLLEPGWRERWEPPSGGGNGRGTDTDGGWGQLRLRLELAFPRGLLVNDPAEALASGFDHATLVNGEGRPLVPGSSLRGALRSRGERILRSLGGPRAACDLNTRGCACHERIEQENAERRKRHEKPLAFIEEVERHCLACRVFGSGRLASAFKVTDFLALAEQGGAELRHEFVAIDRFTGGAASGAKFDALARSGVVVAGEIQLEIGRHRLSAWSLGLLALVLRDVLLADLPLGFGTAKGFNEYAARVTAVDRFWARPPAALEGADPRPPGCAGWAPPTDQALDSPVTAGELAEDLVRRRMESWVAALLHRIAALETQEGGRV